MLATISIAGYQNSAFQLYPLIIDFDLTLLCFPIGIGLIYSIRLCWYLTIIALTASLSSWSLFVYYALTKAEFFYIKGFRGYELPLSFGYVVLLISFIYYIVCFWVLFKKENRVIFNGKT
jgi:hypothetical protein